MPSLAISCAAREALHQADVVETMLRGIVPVIRNNDLRLSGELRKLDDTVDELYSAIKFYLTQISGEALSKEESRRWTDIVSFTINMEQIGDIIERVLQDIEDKKVKKNRSFSEAGMAEIVHLHERLLANLRLAMSVFLDGHVRDAKRLLEEKAHFRDLEHEYAANHIARLRENTAQSIETSSLHLDLISDLKRINSHICGVAYPILESAGALTATRIRQSQFAALGAGRRRRALTPRERASTAMLSLADIELLFARHGAEQYSGEPVTQLEHALQTAHFAEQSDAGDELVTACLLHDLGHLLNAAGRDADACAASTTRTSTSRCRSCAACSPTRCSTRSSCTSTPSAISATRPGYHARLSDDSKRSLALQGGVFDAARRPRSSPSRQRATR